jgi:hypothetical protein
MVKQPAMIDLCSGITMVSLKRRTKSKCIKVVTLAGTMAIILLSILMASYPLTAAQTPSKTISKGQWILDINFQPYSIDIKTETLQTSYFLLSLLNWDNSSGIHGVILKTDKGGSMGFGTDVLNNDTGVQGVIFKAATDPSQVEPRNWKLQPVRTYGLGSPFDYYRLNIFFAVNETLDLANNSTLLVVAPNLLDDWEFKQQLERFDTAIDNATLSKYGLDTTTFAQHASIDDRGAGVGHLQDYYLYTLIITPKPTYEIRIALTFLFMPSLIFAFLIIIGWKYKQKVLSFSNLLTIYLAIALFIMPFLVSFYQYAPPVTLTWQEVLLIGDFVFSTALVIYALVTKKPKKPNTVIDRDTV